MPLFNNNEDSEKTYRIGKQVIKESDLKMRIPYKGETFTLRYPTPLTRAMIESETARRLGGLPRSAYSPDHLANVEAYATVDVLMIPEECPPWFTSPWECLDEDLVSTLFRGYFQFRDRFREKLREGKLEGGGKGSGP